MLRFLRLSWDACNRVRPLRQRESTRTPLHSTFATGSTSDTSAVCASNPPTFRSLTAARGFAHKHRTLPSRSRCRWSATPHFGLVGSSSPHTGRNSVTRVQTMFSFFPTAGAGFYGITMRTYFTLGSEMSNHARPRMRRSHCCYNLRFPRAESLRLA
jgi:hypothetical protein